MNHGAVAYGQAALGGSAIFASSPVLQCLLTDALTLSDGVGSTLLSPNLVKTLGDSFSLSDGSIGYQLGPSFILTVGESLTLLDELSTSLVAPSAIGTSVFPNALDTADNLLIAANNAASTLAVDLSSSALSLTVVNASAFPPIGAITLDLLPFFQTATSSEIVYYSAKVGNVLTLTARGRDGTTAKAFTAGAVVECRNTARHHNVLADALVAVEGEVLSVGSQVQLRALLGHIHPISDTTGLQAALDAKALLSHGHVIADSTGLQAALDAKALLSHAHVIANTTGLQAALDAKASIVDINPMDYGASPAASGTTNRAAIQAAIDACPDFGTVKLPAGSYLLSGAGAELLLINKNINFIGAGPGSVLLIDSSVGATVDVIRVTGTTIHFHQRIAYLHVKALFGTPARHTLALDVNGTGLTGHQQFEMSIDHNRFERMNSVGRSIMLNFPAGTDGFYCSSISDNVLERGISLLRCGDSVWIERNTFWWRGDVDAGACAAINLSTAAGVARIVIRDNNCTLAGGLLQAVSGAQLLIENNQVEQLAASVVGTPPAQIALSGSTARHTNCRIINNNLNGHNFCDHNILVEFADDTYIDGNTLSLSLLQSVYIGINAVRTRFGYNAGTATINDLGTDSKKVSFVVL